MFEHTAASAGDLSAATSDALTRTRPSAAAIGSLAAPRFTVSPRRLAGTDYVDFEFLRSLEQALGATHPRTRWQP